MKEHHPLPICSKRVRILCQMGLIAVSPIPLAVRDVFADVPTGREGSRSQILLARNMQGNEMITNANLYEAIFKRKSIREYDLAPLDGHTLSEVMAHTSALNPLYDDIKTEIKLLSQKDVKGLFLENEGSWGQTCLLTSLCLLLMSHALL